MTCPHCGQAAEFHSHRPHTSLSLVGPVRYAAPTISADRHGFWGGSMLLTIVDPENWTTG